MRIAYITENFYRMSETFIRDLALGLHRSGHEVTVHCSESSQPLLPELSAHVVRSGWMLPHRFQIWRWALLNQMGEAGRYRAAKLLQKWASARILKQLEESSCDVAYVDYGTVAVAALPALRRLGIPLVVHFHGFDITSQLSDVYYRGQLKQLFEYASKVIANTDHLKRLLILEGCPKTKIVKVPLGVDVNKWLPMNWADRLKGAPSIVFLGRFAAKKNPVALLEAFAIALAQVPNAKLTMIGDGEEMSRVKARVSSLGIEGSVDILGAMPQEQALEAVRRHWIYAQHSVTPTSGDQETFGLSLAEAQAMELGVVSTYHNGIPENVIEGETGLLCREYDYETMGAHMVSLLKDKEELRRMGVAGRKHVLNSFQPEVRKKAIISILERLK